MVEAASEWPLQPSAEVPSDSWIAQVHEVLALQSIFEDNVRASAGAALPPGQFMTDEVAEALISKQPPAIGLQTDILVDVDVQPGGLYIQAAGSQESVGAQDHDRGGPAAKLAEGVRVDHLPPLQLHARFPPTYPEEDPPDASICAGWLSTAQLAALQQGLLRLWEDQGPGGPILFTWADWLKTCALEHLGAASTLVVGQGRPAPAAMQSMGAVAHGGGSDSVQQEDVLLQLLRYDATCKHKLFLQGTWTCGICLEEVRGSGCGRASDCEHFFCRPCLARMCSAAITEGTLHALRCPDPACRAPFVRQHVAGWLGDGEGARWEALELAQGLARMADLVFCPRCATGCLVDKDELAHCPACFFAFCALCNGSWHPGTECMTAETRLKLLQERMAGNKSSVEELRRREQELLSLARIEGSSRRCPSCSMAIQKEEGCNKMTCSYCGAYFCYRCGKQISDYEHFRNGTCVLFEAGDLERWEAQWGANRDLRQLQANVQLREAGRRVKNCPQCGQVIAKSGNNNHMCCWACNSHFCYLCRQVLRGSTGKDGGHHFSVKSPCKQHTPD